MGRFEWRLSRNFHPWEEQNKPLNYLLEKQCAPPKHPHRFTYVLPLLIIFFFGICILRRGSPTPSLDHMACVPHPVLSSASPETHCFCRRSCGSLHCRVPSPCRPEGESKVFLVSQTTDLHLLGRHCELCILLFPILRWPLEASELNLMFLKKLNRTTI